jgi:hypothetical protein
VIHISSKVLLITNKMQGTGNLRSRYEDKTGSVQAWSDPEWEVFDVDDGVESSYGVLSDRYPETLPLTQPQNQYHHEGNLQYQAGFTTSLTTESAEETRFTPTLHETVEEAASHYEAIYHQSCSYQTTGFVDQPVSNPFNAHQGLRQGHHGSRTTGIEYDIQGIQPGQEKDSQTATDIAGLSDQDVYGDTFSPSQVIATLVPIFPYVREDPEQREQLLNMSNHLDSTNTSFLQQPVAQTFEHTPSFFESNSHNRVLSPVEYPGQPGTSVTGATSNIGRRYCTICEKDFAPSSFRWVIGRILMSFIN